MASLDNLSEDDWEFLQRTLESATDAVMVAHPGGSLQEVFAVFRGWKEVPELFPGNLFVQELLSVTPEELRDLNDQDAPEDDPTAAEVLTNAASKCSKAVALLTTKAPTEVDTYRRVVLFLAEKVARAASEGGFLGIGGKRISEPEVEALTQLATALGIENYQTPV